MASQKLPPGVEEELVRLDTTLPPDWESFYVIRPSKLVRENKRTYPPAMVDGKSDFEVVPWAARSPYYISLHCRIVIFASTPIALSARVRHLHTALAATADAVMPKAVHA